MRLYFYAVCHLLQLASDDVPYFIVAKRRETSSGARESILNREGGTTDTSRREPCRVPAIPQCQTIAKFTLRQAEPMPCRLRGRHVSHLDAPASLPRLMECWRAEEARAVNWRRASVAAAFTSLRLEAFRLATSARSRSSS